MYYAAVNYYANATSQGFSNTWGVVQFSDKGSRDQFVSEALDLATKTISAKEVEDYGGVQYAYTSKGLVELQPQ